MVNGLPHSLLRNGLEGFNRALDWWLFELGEILRLVKLFKKENILEFELSIEDEACVLARETAQVFETMLESGRRHGRAAS